MRIKKLRILQAFPALLVFLVVIALAGLPSACIWAPTTQTYDIVIEGGRVIDPETGLDAVRNVGINGGTIARIAERPLQGETIIDAHGLVVAPGFIDMHSHALTTPSMRQQAMDGVTTTLELELGSLPVGKAYALLEREGRPINYGFSVSWALARMQVMDGLGIDGSTVTYQKNVGKPGWRQAADSRQAEQILALIGQGLDEGGLGIGVMLGYAPATSAEEYVAVNRLAAARGVPTFTHVRYANFAAPGSTFEGLEEFIDVARQTVRADALLPHQFFLMAEYRRGPLAVRGRDGRGPEYFNRSLSLRRRVHHNRRGKVCAGDSGQCGHSRERHLYDRHR
jgi:N-acyl-D-glutamate deacylase